MFNEFVSHIPSYLKNNLCTDNNDYSYTLTKLKELDPNVYWEKEFKLERISKAALQALRQAKLGLAETASIHMVLGAIDEIYLDSQMSVVYRTGDLGPTIFYSYPLNTLHGNSDPRPVRFECHSYLSAPQKTRESLNQKTIAAPYLKSFFALTDREWARFTELIEKTSEMEQQLYLFHLPKHGCWSPIYAQICDVFRCFHPIERFRGNGNYEKLIVVPSFTMLQTLLQVKGEMRNRSFLKLVPVLGELSEGDVEKMKRANETPLGLFSPISEALKTHMKVIDGHSGNGPLSFMIHDAAHALREQEMTESVSWARFRFIDTLRALPKPDNKLISKLTDGELNLSYNDDISPLYESFGDNFGAIFHRQPSNLLWTKALKASVIQDMIANRALWEKQHHITEKDLWEEELEIYRELRNDIYWKLDDSKIIQIKVKAFDHVIQNSLQPCLEYPGKIVHIKNAKLISLECHSALVEGSEIDFIKATGNVVLISNSTCKRIITTADLLLYGSTCPNHEVYNLTYGRPL